MILKNKRCIIISSESVFRCSKRRGVFIGFEIGRGRPHPLGATLNNHGVNFCVFSENATSVELLIFENETDETPLQIVPFDPEINNTFHFWHVFVKGLKAGALYAYRVDGPNNLKETGNRFNKNKVLIDPYSRSISKAVFKRETACNPDDNTSSSMRSIVVDPENYDWGDDKPLARPMGETIIYETHVRGFTKSPSSKTSNPGTFSGLAEKIPYLKDLGITAVQMMPVFDFDNTYVLREYQDKKLFDYWGYNPLGFFAPNSSYSSRSKIESPINEFRDLVKALHKEGIEVILDVVFNHTGEQNQSGPIISLKGFDNSIYYYLVPDNKEFYLDFSGCGNTLNCNHPIVEKFIVDCLEYWVCEMHVDGFRFDEASILSRGEDGRPLEHPPLLWHIELSEKLANTKIIAEAWDAAGLYQVGYFPGYRSADLNGHFRDDVRRFVKGDGGKVESVASRIAGSADIYQTKGRLPINSVNFITSHDGFTLNDLVSYNTKYNDVNGENNADGFDDQTSWNCGAEGVTDDEKVERLRISQIKNFATILLISRGVPMILMGDEVRRTQYGNNNAYCQDNELSWFDWNNLEQNKEVHRFFTKMIEFRKSHHNLHSSEFFTDELNERGLKNISWHGTKLNSPGFKDPEGRALSITIGSPKDEEDIHIMANMAMEELEFEIPEVKGRKWFLAINTSERDPGDIIDSNRQQIIDGTSLKVAGHSIMILVSKNG